MSATYRVLAYVTVALVALQAAFIGFGDFGLNEWIAGGGELNQALIEDEEGPLPFAGVIGYILHGLVGQFLIPLIALILLIVSFFAKVTKGMLLAGIVFGLVVVQVILGLSEIPALGALHGINALAIFAMAMIAAGRAKAGTDVAAGAPVRT